MGVQWWTGILAFVGAVVGGIVTYLAALRQVSQRESDARRDRGQREEQGHLEEWGRRFTAALDGVMSDDVRRRSLGRVVLVELSRSHLASQEERELAKAVLDAGARLDDAGEDVTTRPPGVRMDDIVFVEENEEQEGGP